MAKKAEPKKSAPKTTDVAAKVLETAMKLAAEGEWRDLSLAEIADAAKIPLAKVYPVYPSKQAILGALFRQIDTAV
ncbi:MAG TPA: TetR family transcriptional regulator, partial [Kiloniellales bacterium]